jgi:hypothetical protein
MSQYAGDAGSKMMFARSQYEQNAKRKNVIIPKGTAFKNVKIRSNYNNSDGTYYLSTLTVKDKKRGAYDEAERAFKESDFKVTNLSQAGNNFFNVKNFLVVNNNGFDISENAIVDIELNKDITVSIFDEPFEPVFTNNGFPPVANFNNQAPQTSQTDTVLCNNGLRDITYGAVAPCSYAGGVAMNQDPQNNQVSFLESNQKLIVMVLIGIGLYIGYKKFME